VAIFGGEEGEGVRLLHGAEGGRHNEEQRGGWQLDFEDDQMNWVGGPNVRLGRTAN
jgi:hypothetical protein